MDAIDPRTPVTILTGWLGAGKTTLLNELLTQPHGQRIAVLINEFGEIGVDDRLVKSSKEDVVELRNGCVCCSVRGDLITALERLQKRRHGRWWRKPEPFDRLVIETTGIAEPAPLLRTFLVEPGVATAWQPGSVVTLVDALNAEAAFRHAAAREQVAVADRLVVNKRDLVDADALTKLEAQVRTMNPAASLTITERGSIAATELLADAGFAGFDSTPTEETHDHAGIGSVSLTEDAPLDELKVQLWLDACVKLLGEKLLRYKGFLSLAGHDRRIVLQGVYELYSADAGDPWNNEPRRSEIVFIGEDLDAAFLRRGLDACRA